MDHLVSHAWWKRNIVVNDHPLKRVACEEQADVDQFARKGSR